MSTSMYAEELRRRGFVPGQPRPATQEDLDNADVRHECKENTAFMELWKSHKPFFHYLNFEGKHTVAFDELRELWFLHDEDDLRPIGFVLYDPSTRSVASQARPN